MRYHEAGSNAYLGVAERLAKQRDLLVRRAPRAPMPPGLASPARRASQCQAAGTKASPSYDDMIVQAFQSMGIAPPGA